jgi:hypothetical protein
MKSFRRVLAVGLVSVLACVNLYAQNGVLLKNSNLRKSPTLTSPVIKIIPKGTSIVIKEKHGEWLAVQNGYIFSALVGDKVEEKLTLVHQVTHTKEKAPYLLDKKFVKFDKCDKFGWCKLKGEDSYVKEYLYLKKDDGRYMKKGPDLAYIYKKVQMPVSYDPNEKVVNVNMFKGQEREKLNNKKNTKFGYVKLKKLLGNTQKQEEVTVTAPKVIDTKSEMKTAKKIEPKVEVKKVEKTVKAETIKKEVEKEKLKVEKTEKVVEQKTTVTKPKKEELSADEKRLLELQKMIKEYDKQLADLEKK